jgi:hypothetical protein
MKTESRSHFTISFYDGEGDDRDFKKIRHGKTYPVNGIFQSMIGAVIWCQNHGFNIYAICITEWDPNETDGYGTPEIVGSRNLGGAYDNEYHRLWNSKGGKSKNK